MMAGLTSASRTGAQLQAENPTARKKRVCELALVDWLTTDDIFWILDATGSSVFELCIKTPYQPESTKILCLDYQRPIVEKK